MTLHGRGLIAGRLGSTDFKASRACDPSTGEALGPDFFPASDDEVGEALAAAAAAGEVYGRKTPQERAQFLEAIAREIEGLGPELIARCRRETALPEARLVGERARTCGQLRLFAEVVREGSWVDARIDPALPDRQPVPRPDLRRMLIPIGPVVVFGSSNFPLAFSVAGGDTASAFAAGCGVVVKAHPAHPGTSEMVAGAISRAAEECAIPAGVFSLLHGPGQTVGVALVRHPAAAAVGFTGSHAAGRALFDVAVARPRPIPVFAEMSSSNPVFLLPGGLAERGPAIAQGLLASFTLGVGQFCTKPGLVFAVRGPGTDAFLGALEAAVRASAWGTLLSPGIRDSFGANRARILGFPGVSAFSESSSLPEAAGVRARPTVAATTASDFLRSPEMALEAFGPFTLIVLADSPQELLACAAALEGQLTATFHGTPRDLEASGPLIALLRGKAGRLLVNSFPTGVEVCPSMQHGGPYPATSDPRFTSVGTAAMFRFARPVCYQGFTAELLPAELRDGNPAGIMRLVNGRLTRDAVA